jgi:hypothetical protein
VERWIRVQFRQVFEGDDGVMELLRFIAAAGAGRLHAEELTRGDPTLYGKGVLQQ